MDLIVIFLADPNDPLLDRFKDNTTAKKFEPSKSLSTSSLLPTAKPRISSPATSGSGHQDIRSRVGAKVTAKRIKNRQLAAKKVN